MGERDERISLLQRLVEHANNTARYNIWYGEGRDAYDVAGRTAHEVDLQHQQRRLPLPLLAARLLAVQHLDPRPGLGDARLRRAARMARDAQRRRARRRRRPRRDRSDVSEGGPRHVRLLHREHAHRRHPLLGHRRPGPRANSATTSTGPPIRSTTTNRSTARPPRSPRRACCGSATTWSTSAAKRRPASATSRPA